MAETLKSACDAVLQRIVSGRPRVPGVVAIATDRKGDIYEGVAGKRILGEDAEMTADSVFAIFSTTKAVTGTALLQCVEEGKVDLDAPARAYVPEIGELQVIEGFDDAGRPRLRPPRREVTARMLMLHTAGFGYDVFNETYRRLVEQCGHPSTGTARRASLMAPLLFDPGERWEYGCNIDWCGQIVERVRGKRLGAVMRERLFDPLGMADIGFAMTPSMERRMARIHKREPDGSLTLRTDLEPVRDPELDMGGQGLYATAAEYMKFIRMWLNDGAGPNGPVLRPETVQAAVRNGLDDLKIKMLPGVIAELTNDAELFPGMPKSWAYSFMINDREAPTGRPAGALGWAGLTNLYYWIDRQNGLGGFWATSVLPFADPFTIAGYMDFESAVYQHAKLRQAA